MASPYRGMKVGIKAEHLIVFKVGHQSKKSGFQHKCQNEVLHKHAL